METYTNHEYGAAVGYGDTGECRAMVRTLSMRVNRWLRRNDLPMVTFNDSPTVQVTMPIGTNARLIETLIREFAMVGDVNYDYDGTRTITRVRDAEERIDCLLTTDLPVEDDYSWLDSAYEEWAANQPANELAA